MSVFNEDVHRPGGRKRAKDPPVMTCCFEWQDPWDYRTVGSHEWDVAFRRESSEFGAVTARGQQKKSLNLKFLIFKVEYFQTKNQSRKIVFFLQGLCLLICEGLENRWHRIPSRSHSRLNASSLIRFSQCLTPLLIPYSACLWRRAFVLVHCFFSGAFSWCDLCGMLKV